MTDNVAPGSTTLHPLFFATPTDIRAWLDVHHASARELWVGLYKK